MTLKIQQLNIFSFPRWGKEGNTPTRSDMEKERQTQDIIMLIRTCSS